MKIKSLEIFGIFAIIGIGIFLHYAYEIFDQNQFVKLIAPVNESVWEHLKMAFYGILIYGAIEYMLAVGEQRNLLFTKVFSAILASFLIVVMYYGYTSFMESNVVIDIAIFVITVIIVQLISLGIIQSNFYFNGLNFFALIALVCGILIFSSYTYQPPQHEIFIEHSE